jgi:quercetin dioxygenase-like cupin family protein
MNKKNCLVFISLFIAFSGSVLAEGFKLENLMKEKLEGVPNTEVVVSKVQIPANTSLPKHWHPGEEFAYVIKGSVTLWQKGKDDLFIKEGEAAKVPLKQIHTAMTGEEGVTLLVFRVHEEGKPERIKVK